MRDLTLQTAKIAGERRMAVADPAELAMLLAGAPERRDRAVVAWDASEMRPSGVVRLVVAVRASARSQRSWLPQAAMFVAGLACGVGWTVANLFLF